MTYHSKGELFDEVMYKLAREIYKTRLGGSEESTKSWEETFLKHSGVTIDEYINFDINMMKNEKQRDFPHVQEIQA